MSYTRWTRVGIMVVPMRNRGKYISGNDVALCVSALDRTINIEGGDAWGGWGRESKMT